MVIHAFGFGFKPRASSKCSPEERATFKAEGFQGFIFKRGEKGVGCGGQAHLEEELSEMPGEGEAGFGEE